MNEDIEFLKELKKYIPTRCRGDAGCNFNLVKVHLMIERFLEKKQNE
jgi:hypothetical protein